MAGKSVKEGQTDVDSQGCIENKERGGIYEELVDYLSSSLVLGYNRGSLFTDHGWLRWSSRGPNGKRGNPRAQDQATDA